VQLQKAIHDYKWRATPKASNFPKLHKHHNLLAKVLTEKLYNDLKGKETKSGVTLDDCIQTGECKAHPPPFILSM